MVDGLDLGIGKESDDLVWSNDSEKQQLSASYIKIKELIAYVNLKAIRISWEFKPSSTSEAFTIVYVNGIQVGVEKSNDTAVYVGVSDDIVDIKKDDLIQIYGKAAPDFCLVKNMRVKYVNFENNDPESG